MFRYFLLISFIAGTLLLQSQDVHFSQYDLSPLSLNPAETGAFDGDWRAAINYRQQWKAIGKPFQTVAASYDQNIYSLPGNFSAGLLFIGDQSGTIDLAHNRAYLSLGYKVIKGDLTMSAGFQAGYVSKNYNLSGTTFPEQYNSDIGLFDPNMALSEKGLGNQTGYLDLNVGVLAERKFENAVITAGFSLLHLNRPNVSFFDQKDQLPERYNTYVRWKQDISNNLYIRPTFLMSLHSKAQELVFGGDFGMYFSENDAGVREAYVGIDLRNGVERNGDAFITSVGFLYQNFHFGFAYDVNYSSLDRITNNRGAFEISVIYISPSTAINRITIPCDRY